MSFNESVSKITDLLISNFLFEKTFYTTSLLYTKTIDFKIKSLVKRIVSIYHRQLSDRLKPVLLGCMCVWLIRIYKSSIFVNNTVLLLFLSHKTHTFTEF